MIDSNLAICEVQLGHFNEAIETLIQIEQKDPSSLFALNLLKKAYEGLNQPEKALEMQERMNALKSKEPAAIN